MDHLFQPQALYFNQFLGSISATKPSPGDRPASLAKEALATSKPKACSETLRLDHLRGMENSKPKHKLNNCIVLSDGTWTEPVSPQIPCLQGDGWEPPSQGLLSCTPNSLSLSLSLPAISAQTRIVYTISPKPEIQVSSHSGLLQGRTLRALDPQQCYFPANNILGGCPTNFGTACWMSQEGAKQNDTPFVGSPRPPCHPVNRLASYSWPTALGPRRSSLCLKSGVSLRCRGAGWEAEVRENRSLYSIEPRELSP